MLGTTVGMTLILLKDVQNLGKKGDRVGVNFTQAKRLIEKSQAREIAVADIEKDDSNRTVADARNQLGMAPVDAVAMPGAAVPVAGLEYEDEKADDNKSN